jgi:hypothetical protein
LEPKGKDDGRGENGKKKKKRTRRSVCEEGPKAKTVVGCFTT